MQDDDEQNRLVGWILGAAVTSVIGLCLALALIAANGGFSGASSASAAASVVAPGASSSASGSGGSTTASSAASSATAASNAPAASAAPAADASRTASASNAIGLPYQTRLYFETNVSTLPVDGADALRSAVAAARAHPAAQVAISGFHDKTGNVEQNEELAKARAMSVRNALIAAGIGEGRIEMRKPQVTEGGTDDREARRVEVSVQ